MDRFPAALSNVTFGYVGKVTQFGSGTFKWATLKFSRTFGVIWVWTHALDLCVESEFNTRNETLSVANRVPSVKLPDMKLSWEGRVIDRKAAKPEVR